jgi:hypothetical protein
MQGTRQSYQDCSAARHCFDDSLIVVELRLKQRKPWSNLHRIGMFHRSGVAYINENKVERLVTMRKVRSYATRLFITRTSSRIQGLHAFKKKISSFSITDRSRVVVVQRGSCAFNKEEYPD